MKGILLDENVPAKITFTSRLPVIHASDLGTSLSDTYLWNYARQYELVIVSKDAELPAPSSLLFAPSLYMPYSQSFSRKSKHYCQRIS
jgi:predicted nuclease of predicted toxin-antitoxin system